MNWSVGSKSSLSFAHTGLGQVCWIQLTRDGVGDEKQHKVGIRLQANGVGNVQFLKKKMCLFGINICASDILELTKKCGYIN